MLAVELPIAEADRRRARPGDRPDRSAIADRLLEESAGWLWIGGRIPDQGDRTSRDEALLDRYAARLPELLGADAAERRRRPSAAEPRRPPPMAADA